MRVHGFSQQLLYKLSSGRISSTSDQDSSHPQTMRRSSSSSPFHPITQLHVIKHLSSRQFSSASPPVAQRTVPLLSSPDPHSNNRASGSLLKWLSGILVGSGIGYLSWSTFDKDSFVSFADWSAPVTSASVVNQSSSSLKEKSKFLFADSFRRRVFFNYEKRIRLRSPPEKVFEYFASVKSSNGEILMSPADLMRATVPVFPPSESDLVRDGYLRGERSPGDLQCAPSDFFMLFDVNNDGHVSFKEYIFFVTLLSIPESSFSVAFKMFDLDNNGEIDKEEFKKVMALMRAHNRQGAFHRDGLRAGMKVTGSVENGGLVEFFFGKDGKASLTHDKFVKFLRDLHEEMLKLEFDHYDYKSQGTILAKDFALSLVASADISHLGKLLKRVKELSNNEHLRDIRLTFEEFKTFGELRRRLQPFSLALFSFGEANGLLTKEDFKRAALQVCGVAVTDNVVDIVFHVFDKNCDGCLSSDEFIRVLEKRERDIAQPMESGPLGLFSCCWNCSHKASIARLLF